MMSELFSKLSTDPLAVSLISLVAGALITAIVVKISNKTSVFRWSIRVDRIGLTTDDPVFGNVRVTWQNQQVRNLYTATLDLENATTRDFVNVNVKIYSDNGTFLLNERTAIVGTPYIVQWSEEFKRQLLVPQGQVPTQAQWNQYNHTREYAISVFNRGQNLQFAYLCTRPGDDQIPGVWLSSLTPGVRLQLLPNLSQVHGVPGNVALWRGLIISVLVVIVCGLFVGDVWIASALAMLVGLGAQIFGAIEYKVERYIRNLISG